MPVIFQKKIARTDLAENRDRLYVFGDNIMRTGYGGQAGAMRGEVNAIGLPTKFAPTTHEQAYFSDGALAICIKAASADIDTLLLAARNGVVIVWPTDGIGTGLAQLPQRAPRIKQFYDELLQDLQAF